MHTRRITFALLLGHGRLELAFHVIFTPPVDGITDCSASYCLCLKTLGITQIDDKVFVWFSLYALRQFSFHLSVIWLMHPEVPIQIHIGAKNQIIKEDFYCLQCRIIVLQPTNCP